MQPTLELPLDQPPISTWRDGDEVDAVLLVREVERRQKRDGSPFLRLTLADRSGDVPAVLWEPRRRRRTRRARRRRCTSPDASPSTRATAAS